MQVNSLTINIIIEIFDLIQMCIFSSDFKHERIADFLPQMNHYDVIAFQDMCLTGNVNVTPLLEHARRLGFEFISSPPLPWFTLPVFDGGLLVLSRFPIVETEFVRFDDAAYADRFRDKGIRYWYHLQLLCSLYKLIIYKCEFLVAQSSQAIRRSRIALVQYSLAIRLRCCRS
jgi:hypothetical protein